MVLDEILRKWKEYRAERGEPSGDDACFARLCGLPVLGALYDLASRLTNECTPYTRTEVLTIVYQIINVALFEAERRTRLAGGKFSFLDLMYDPNLSVIEEKLGSGLDRRSRSTD